MAIIKFFRHLRDCHGWSEKSREQCQFQFNYIKGLERQVSKKKTLQLSMNLKTKKKDISFSKQKYKKYK